MTSSKYFTGLIASPYQVATLYIKYHCLIDIWVKFGCSELISYVPACDPIFTKIAKKWYDVIKKFEACFSNSLSAGYSWYQISLFNKHLGEIWKLWVNFLRSRTFPQVLLKYPKNVMTSSKYLKHVKATLYQLGTLYFKYHYLKDILVKFGGSESISYVPARRLKFYAFSFI